MGAHIGPSPGGNGNGWRNYLLGFLLMVLGWIATAATTDRAKMADELSENRQRIAILEEQSRNTRESLAEIKTIVKDVQRQLQERRR